METIWNISDLQHLVPVALGDDLRPVDAGLLDNLPDRADRWLFVAPARSVLNRAAHQLLTPPQLQAWPDTGIFYADSGVMRGDRLVEIDCKPGLNPSLLLAKDYIGFPLIIRSSTFARLGGVRLEYGPAAWYDFCLRAYHAGVNFERLPTTMIGIPSDIRRPGVEEREKVLKQYIIETGQPFSIQRGRASDAFQWKRAFGEYPSISLVIPTRQGRPSNGQPYIVDLLRSIVTSTWPLDKIDIIIGDDVEDDTIYQEFAGKLNIGRIITDRPPSEPFNYARKMNRLWRAAETELLVLMNDDMTVNSPEWLEALFTFAISEDVGGVGARLLFPDNRVQHAGMVGGLHGVCGHPWWAKPADEKTYQDWALVHRDWCVVTGATFATRKSIMEFVNGFDERFSLEFNDVDLCLRLKMLGYRIVYTPHAELIHYERSSRGETLRPGEEVALFLRRWNDYLMDDPMYNPQLVQHSEVQPRSERFEVLWER